MIYGNSDITEAVDASCSVLLIRSNTKVDSCIKEKFPALQFIIRVGVGLDNIDVDYCTREKIEIFNAPGSNANAVSDYVLCTLLMVTRNLVEYRKEDGMLIDRLTYLGDELNTKSVGFIGFGNIARLVYQKLRVFGVTDFFVFDPYLNVATMQEHFDVKQLSSVEEVLSSASIISFHLPLTKETHHLLSKANIPCLQDNAIVINTSRGGIICEEDLLQSIDQKKLFYIADIVENEPFVNTKLLKAKNVFLTPHIASMTHQANEQMATTAIQNFLRRK